jgi:putative endonuclease
MKGYLYILMSLRDGRTYTGSTDNLERRLNQHKKGLVSSTRNRRPLNLIYEETFENVIDARRREKYFKTCSGRRKLAIILEKIKPQC